MDDIVDDVIQSASKEPSVPAVVLAAVDEVISSESEAEDLPGPALTVNEVITTETREILPEGEPLKSPDIQEKTTPDIQEKTTPDIQEKTDKSDIMVNGDIASPTVQAVITSHVEDTVVSVTELKKDDPSALDGIKRDSKSGVVSPGGKESKRVSGAPQFPVEHGVARMSSSGSNIKVCKMSERGSKIFCL